MWKLFVCSTVLAITCNTTFAQNKAPKWAAMFDSTYYTGYRGKAPLRKLWLSYSQSKNVLDYQALSYGIDALEAMYQATNKVAYLDDAILIANNVMGAAKVVDDMPITRSPFHDNYHTWIVTDSSKQYHGIYLKETALSEVYIFQYISHLLYIIRNNSSLYATKRYRDFYDATLVFTEKNVWEKWYSRGYKLGEKSILEGRAHMQSHWAYIACILYKLTANPLKKAQYQDAYNTYNKLLKSNFRTLPGTHGFFVWNSTWDSNPHNDEVDVEDVSHGNLVVSYIVQAYSLHVYWSKADIVNLCNLVKDFLWIKDQYNFKDNLDGSKLQTGSRGGFQSDGWVKLARYDRTLQAIYTTYVMHNTNSSYVTNGQLFANLALNAKLLAEK